MKALPRILRVGIINLIICAISVVIAYQYIDKPVALFVRHDHTLSHSHTLKLFTYISVIFWGMVCLIYIYELIRYAYQKQNYMDQVLLLVAHSVVISSFFKDVLKILFGRYWPETFYCNNLSLLNNQVYGFNWFRGQALYGSFPSGHTTTIVAAMTVLWFTYPKWRVLYCFLIMLVVLGLIGLDYHFVSDVIAGGFLGGLVSYYLLIMSGFYQVNLNNT